MESQMQLPETSYLDEHIPVVLNFNEKVTKAEQASGKADEKFNEDLEV